MMFLFLYIKYGASFIKNVKINPCVFLRLFVAVVAVANKGLHRKNTSNNV